MSITQRYINYLIWKKLIYLLFLLNFLNITIVTDGQFQCVLLHLHWLFTGGVMVGGNMGPIGYYLFTTITKAVQIGRDRIERNIHPFLVRFFLLISMGELSFLFSVAEHAHWIFGYTKVDPSKSFIVLERRKELQLAAPVVFVAVTLLAFVTFTSSPNSVLSRKKNLWSFVFFLETLFRSFLLVVSFFF